MSRFQTLENNNLAINAAKSIGCSLVNIGATNIMEGVPHLVLGVAWQIIRKTLLNNISLKNHPELWRLLEVLIIFTPSLSLCVCLLVYNPSTTTCIICYYYVFAYIYINVNPIYSIYLLSLRLSQSM